MTALRRCAAPGCQREARTSADGTLLHACCLACELAVLAAWWGRRP